MDGIALSFTNDVTGNLMAILFDFDSWYENYSEKNIKCKNLQTNTNDHDKLLIINICASSGVARTIEFYNQKYIWTLKRIKCPFLSLARVVKIQFNCSTIVGANHCWKIILQSLIKFFCFQLLTHEKQSTWKYMYYNSTCVCYNMLLCH